MYAAAEASESGEVGEAGSVAESTEKLCEERRRWPAMGPGEPVSEGPLAAGVSAAPAGMGRAGGGGRTRKLATAASGDVSCVLVEASRARDVTDGCRSNGASRRLGVRRSDFNAGDDGELGSVRAGFFFSEDGTLPTKRPVLDDETSDLHLFRFERVDRVEIYDPAI